ncbi:unnamed protein product [Amoebophrya sp. A25]|nr:unnamed protein product [Amoebophrya sp. A25]|eukprot:GSA25T00025663001.1
MNSGASDAAATSITNQMQREVDAGDSNVADKKKKSKKSKKHEEKENKEEDNSKKSKKDKKKKQCDDEDGFLGSDNKKKKKSKKQEVEESNRTTAVAEIKTKMKNQNTTLHTTPTSYSVPPAPVFVNGVMIKQECVDTDDEGPPAEASMVLPTTPAVVSMEIENVGEGQVVILDSGTPDKIGCPSVDVMGKAAGDVLQAGPIGDVYGGSGDRSMVDLAMTHSTTTHTTSTSNPQGVSTEHDTTMQQVSSTQRQHILQLQESAGPLQKQTLTTSNVSLQGQESTSVQDAKKQLLQNMAASACSSTTTTTTTAKIKPDSSKRPPVVSSTSASASKSLTLLPHVVAPPQDEFPTSSIPTLATPAGNKASTTASALAAPTEKEDESNKRIRSLGSTTESIAAIAIAGHDDEIRVRKIRKMRKLMGATNVSDEHYLELYAELNGDDPPSEDSDDMATT